MLPPTYDHLRYLDAKRSVDDRALNRVVLDALVSELARLQRPLNILEIGAGTGTMVSRLAEWGILEGAGYTLLDEDEQALSIARGRLGPQSLGQGPQSLGQGRRGEGWKGRGSAGVDNFNAVGSTSEIALDFVCKPLDAYLEGGPPKGRYHVLIANAFLDLVDVPPLLPRLWTLLQPGHPFWFTINFDGETIFLPEHPLDAAIFALYHRSMDERMRGDARSGDSRTGRHLLEQLPRSGASLVTAGSSDWVVHAVRGDYFDDEAYFLHHIVSTIERALMAIAPADAADWQAWLRQRRAQIDQRQLVYIAHQLDILGLAPAP